ncbi:hypothetical protein ACI2LJ_26450 [Streptomyces sp. NPDC088090]|uniref:hypothetical protein n=1 Tax=Streptomyces sp. NPDC088090 TaxID=3365822 RepID=UPI00384C2AC7
MRVWTGPAARAGLTSVLGGAIVLGAAGCSPELRPLAAVYVDERGTAQALLRSCDEDGWVRGPGLRGTAPEASGAAESGTEPEGPGESAEPEGEGPWIGWDAGGWHRAADFPLFAPPPEWEVETRGPATLQPGYSYELSFADPDDSYAYSASVTFDARQLAEVPAGEVLTPQGAMTREAFEELAREAC